MRPGTAPAPGRDGVGSFFEALGKAVDIEEFTPLVFAANGDGDVLTVVRYMHRSRGDAARSASMNLHHWFRLTNGKISYCRCTEDTAGTVDALTR